MEFFLLCDNGVNSLTNSVRNWLSAILRQTSNGVVINKLVNGVRQNIPLKNHTTFKIGGNALYFLEVGAKDDLIRAVKFAKEKKLSFFVLGGGSNLLVSDKGFYGLIIKIQNTEYKIPRARASSVRGRQDTKIYAGAGLPLSLILAKSAKSGLSGLEWAAGIPGTIGGAVRGNAGAFGGSMKDIVYSVETLDAKDFKFKVYDKEDCEFGYRQSIFKKNKNLIIFSAKLCFKKQSKKKIQEKIKEYLDYRRDRHPNDPSAGSVFKNLRLTTYNFKPLVKKFPDLKQFKEKGSVPAAYLISECGLEGRMAGGAKISDRHPNFILNFKGARAKDVKFLINLAKQKVKNKFGIALEEEIQYLGF